MFKTYIFGYLTSFRSFLKTVAVMLSRSTKNYVRVLCIFCTLWLLYLYFSQIFTTPISDSTAQKNVHILIVSSRHSGSSFLESILNTHPDVFYIYEPGHSVWTKLSGETAELLHYPVRDLVHSLFTCDVSPLHFYLPNGTNQLSGFPFFDESRALCMSPACQNSEETPGYNHSRCWYACGGISLENIEGVCRNYTHRVMKEVRILDLKILLPLLHDSKLDLRIIHLVRDPRAVASSRRYFRLTKEDEIVYRGETLDQTGPTNKLPNILDIMAKICKSQAEIYKVGRDAKNFPPERYMLIRHEDLAWDPLPNVNKVYSFGDLSMTPQLKQWLKKVKQKDSSDEPGGFMSYERKSQVATWKWRMTMDFNAVIKIQEVCQEAMELFRYLPVTSKSELKDLNIDLQSVGKRKY